MLGLSLPYCLASPVLGFITDKYPVSLNVKPYLYLDFFFLIMFYVCVDVHQVTRSWFMVIGGTTTAIGFCLLGPVPFLHIPK